MKTLLVTTVALAALGATASATAQEFKDFRLDGNQIVCYDPINGAPNDSPAACAKAAGFNSPGEGARTFTDMGMAGHNGKRITPIDIFRQRCVHGDDLPPETP